MNDMGYQELQAFALIFKAIADNSRAVIGVKDVDGRYMYVNKEYTRLFHHSYHDFIGHTDHELFPRAIADAFRAADLQAQRRPESITVEEQAPVNGMLSDYLSIKFPIHDDAGHVYATGVIATDITELKRLQRELQGLAERDELTNIYNRRKLFEIGACEVRSAQRYDYPLSVMMFDLDLFKQINDIHGHAAGDEMLKGFAGLITSELRKHDTFGRIGGEEFVLILPHTPAENALLLGNRIQQQLAHCRVLADNGAVVQITTSIGISQLHPEQTDFENLLQAADGALYQAKVEGRNCIRMFRRP
ncbi:MAG: sensor domain-containing diguanylate cyclase [Pseudomonadota bacterium]